MVLPEHHPVRSAIQSVLSGPWLATGRTCAGESSSPVRRVGDRGADRASLEIRPGRAAFGRRHDGDELPPLYCRVVEGRGGRLLLFFTQPVCLCARCCRDPLVAGAVIALCALRAGI